MSDMRSYTTLLLPWNEIADYATAIISSVLGRTVVCLPNADSHDYWAIITRETPLSNVEIAKLVRYVDGDPDMLKRALPVESNVTRSVEMRLCEALLRDVLKLDWERSFIIDEGLWLLGHFSESFKPPAAGSDLLYVDGKVVDCSKLMPIRRTYWFTSTFTSGSQSINGLLVAYLRKNSIPYTRFLDQVWFVWNGCWCRCDYETECFDVRFFLLEYIQN